MQRGKRVTVQGPVKKQQPGGMSHRGGIFLCTYGHNKQEGFNNKACVSTWYSSVLIAYMNGML